MTPLTPESGSSYRLTWERKWFESWMFQVAKCQVIQKKSKEFILEIFLFKKTPTYSQITSLAKLFMGLVCIYPLKRDKSPSCFFLLYLWTVLGQTSPFYNKVLILVLYCTLIAVCVCCVYMLCAYMLKLARLSHASLDIRVLTPWGGWMCTLSETLNPLPSVYSKLQI